jgi:hypothetical protein
MTDYELSEIVAGFQSGDLDEVDLRSMLDDIEAWVLESASATAMDLRFYRGVTA